MHPVLVFFISSILMHPLLGYEWVLCTRAREGQRGALIGSSFANLGDKRPKGKLMLACCCQRAGSESRFRALESKTPWERSGSEVETRIEC